MPVKMIDRTGGRYGRLTVLAFSHDQRGAKYWRCLCDCGVERAISFSNISKGKTRSCGCLQAEVKKLPRSRNAAVGNGAPFLRTPEYHSWCGMRKRCLNKNCDAYPLYGGRGISIDPRWDSYATFLDDMGAKPSPKHSLDRINTNGNYTPSNCRWATHEEQAQNRRGVIRVGDASLAKHCRDTGISYDAVRSRVKRGLSLPDALTLDR